MPSAALRQQLGQSDEIVGRGGEGEGEADPIEATELRLLLSGHRLDPAKGFFDALAEALADGVAAMRVVRPSITELRPLLFWATCGLTRIDRSSLTKSSAS